jgi:DNA-binding transcriptional MerR regulator
VPTLEDYARLAPFTLDELVDAANSVLRNRPRLLVSRRTARYYVSQGILPPPSGAPKFARYGTEHLVRFVGARVLLDEGTNLESAKKLLDMVIAASQDGGLSEIQDRLAGRRAAEPDRRLASFSIREEPRPVRRLVSVGEVRRWIELGPWETLEIDATVPLDIALEDAGQRIRDLLTELRDTT